MPGDALGLDEGCGNGTPCMLYGSWHVQLE